MGTLKENEKLVKLIGNEEDIRLNYNTDKGIIVSIVLPVYNCEKYVGRCIESIISQSYKYWELIIIDDGSTDNTNKICQQFENIDNRIVIIYQENAGVSRARNKGIEQAKGKYITFIDADDFYVSDRILNMISIFEKIEDCGLVYSDYHILSNQSSNEFRCENSIVHFMDKNQFVNDILFKQKLTCMWRCMMITSIAKTIKFENIKYAEDLFYILEYVQKCTNIVYSTEKLYYYRRDNIDSMTNNTRQDKYLYDYAEIPLMMLSYLQKYGYIEMKYKSKVAEEYAYSCIRIRRATSFFKFIEIVNNKEFRQGLVFASSKECKWSSKIIFNLFKYRIYIPFWLL